MVTFYHEFSFRNSLLMHVYTKEKAVVPTQYWDDFTQYQWVVLRKIIRARHVNVENKVKIWYHFENKDEMLRINVQLLRINQTSISTMLKF